MGFQVLQTGGTWHVRLTDENGTLFDIPGFSSEAEAKLRGRKIARAALIITLGSTIPLFGDDPTMNITCGIEPVY